MLLDELDNGHPGLLGELNQALSLGTCAFVCTAIVEAGHSVEVWSGNAGWIMPHGLRYCAAARVISAGEPLDLGRLIFAAAHPAMLRRLWIAVWDAQPQPVAEAMLRGRYGIPPFDCLPEDLPAETWLRVCGCGFGSLRRYCCPTATRARRSSGLRSHFRLCTVAAPRGAGSVASSVPDTCRSIMYLRSPEPRM